MTGDSTVGLGIIDKTPLTKGFEEANVTAQLDGPV